MNVLHGRGPCVVCGRNPASGYAQIGDDWYCHGDDDAEPTCYMGGQASLASGSAKWHVVNLRVPEGDAQ